MKYACLVPNAHGKFIDLPVRQVISFVARSSIPGHVPDSTQLQLEGQVSYNYTDDVFYVRRGDKVLKYKYDSMRDIK